MKKYLRALFVCIILGILMGIVLIVNTKQPLSADDKAFYRSASQCALEIAGTLNKLGEIETEDQLSSCLNEVKRIDIVYRGLKSSKETLEGQMIMNELLLDAYRAVDAQQAFLVTKSEERKREVKVHIEKANTMIDNLSKLMAQKKL